MLAKNIRILKKSMTTFVLSKIANKHGQEILKSRCPVSNKKRFHKTDNQEPFPYYLIYL